MCLKGVDNIQSTLLSVNISNAGVIRAYECDEYVGLLWFIYGDCKYYMVSAAAACLNRIVEWSLVRHLTATDLIQQRCFQPH